MTDVELIILGCGNSAGVPAITNYWGKCDPDNPKNRRMRPSVLLKTKTTSLIVDTGPDFKEQFNRENLQDIDAVLYTHIHSDHTMGIDELRTLHRRNKRTYPVYANRETLGELMECFSHMFEESKSGFYKVVCEPHEVQNDQALAIGDITVRLFEQDHGAIKSLGLRIGDIGYSTDMKHLGEKAFEALSGIKIWIADAAGNDQAANPVHASVGEVIEMNKRIGAESVYLTHLPPSMDYETLEKELPEGFHMAWDGLCLKTAIK